MRPELSTVSWGQRSQVTAEEPMLTTRQGSTAVLWSGAVMLTSGEIMDQLNWQSSLKYYLTENVNGQVSHNLPPYFRLLLVVLGTVSGQDYSGG